jgi:hypothetical protein
MSAAMADGDIKVRNDMARELPILPWNAIGRALILQIRHPVQKA